MPNFKVTLAQLCIVYLLAERRKSHHSRSFFTPYSRQLYILCASGNPTLPGETAWLPLVQTLPSSFVLFWFLIFELFSSSTGSCSCYWLAGLHGLLPLAFGTNWSRTCGGLWPGISARGVSTHQQHWQKVSSPQTAQRAECVLCIQGSQGGLQQIRYNIRKPYTLKHKN